MDVATFIGLGAAACTAISFLPQMIKSWKSKSTKDVSLPMYVLQISGAVLWLTYGIMLNSLPMILANSVALVFVLSILYLKVRYG
ncbi:MAG: SemiSWEET transporter [Nanoarchaeota archaeon]|nr:SemiSWEET transporter [Nanoarchaeota archaeon]